MRWGVGATLALPLPPAGLMTKAGSPPSPTKDLWLSALPVLPLALATVLVSTLVAEPGAELSFLEIAPEHYLAKPLIDYRHLGDMLTYVALASVHCVLCLGVVVYFLRKIGALPVDVVAEPASAVVSVMAQSIGAVGRPCKVQKYKFFRCLDCDTGGRSGEARPRARLPTILMCLVMNRP